MTRPVLWILEDAKEAAYDGSATVAAWLVPPSGSKALPFNDQTGALISTSPIETTFASVDHDADPMTPDRVQAELNLIQDQHLPVGWTYSVSILGTHNGEPIRSEFTGVRVPNSDLDPAPRWEFRLMRDAHPPGEGPQLVTTTAAAIDAAFRDQALTARTDQDTVLGNGTALVSQDPDKGPIRLGTVYEGNLDGDLLNAIQDSISVAQPPALRGYTAQPPYNRAITLRSHDNTPLVLPLPDPTQPEEIGTAVATLLPTTEPDGRLDVDSHANPTRFTLFVLPRDRVLVDHFHPQGTHNPGAPFVPTPAFPNADRLPTGISRSAKFEARIGTQPWQEFTWGEIDDLPAVIAANTIWTANQRGALRGGLNFSGEVLYIGKSTESPPRWLVATGSIGSANIDIREAGSELEDFARVSKNTTIGIDKVGDQLSRSASRLLRGDGQWVDPPRTGGTGTDRRLISLDALPMITGYTTGTIINFDGRLYDLLPPTTTNIISGVVLGTDGAGLDNGYAGIPMFQFIVAGVGSNPVRCYIPESVQPTPPGWILVKVHDRDGGFYGEMVLQQLGESGSPGNRLWRYQGGSDRVDGEQVLAGHHITVQFFESSSRGEVGNALAVRATAGAWALHDRQGTGAAPWAITGNADQAPFDKMRVATSTTLSAAEIDSAALVPSNAQLNRWAFRDETRDAGDIPAEFLGSGGSDNGTPAVSDVLYGNNEWRPAPAGGGGGAPTPSNLLALFGPPTVQQRGFALGVDPNNEAALALLDVSGRTGRLEMDTLAANQTQNYSSNTWSSWFDVNDLAMSALTSAQAGAYLVAATVRMEISSGSGRYLVNVRVGYEVNSAVTTIKSVSQNMSTYGGTSLRVVELSGVADVPAGAVIKTQFRLRRSGDAATQLRLLPAVTTGPVNTRNAGTFMQVAALGGVRGERGLPGPAGPAGLTSINVGTGLSGNGVSTPLSVTRPVPTGGAPGQVLKLDGTTPRWQADLVGDVTQAKVTQDIAAAVAALRQLPTGGMAGDFLQRDSGNTPGWIRDPGYRTAQQVTNAINTAFVTRIPTAWKGGQAAGNLPTPGAGEGGEVLTVRPGGTTVGFDPVAVNAGQVLDAVKTNRMDGDRNKIIATGPETQAGGQNQLRLIDAPEVVPADRTFPTTPDTGERFELLAKQTLSDPATLVSGDDPQFTGWFGTVGGVSAPAREGTAEQVGDPLPGIDAIYYWKATRRVLVLRRAGNEDVFTGLNVAVQGAAPDTITLGQRANSEHIWETQPLSANPIPAGQLHGVNVVKRGGTLVRPAYEYDVGDYVWDGIRWAVDSASGAVIRDKLESLHDEERLDFSAIKGVPARQFARRLHDGPGVGLSVATSNTSVRPINITLFDEGVGGGQQGINFGSNVNDPEYVQRGEIHGDVTISIVEKADPNLGLRIPGVSTANEDSVRLDDILFLADLRQDADYDRTSDATQRATTESIAGGVDVYNGSARLGRVRVGLAHNAANQVGYVVWYQGRGSSSLRFNIAIDLNVSWSPTDANPLPTQADDPIVNVDGDTWAIFPHDGMFPTVAYGSDPSAGQWGETTRFSPRIINEKRWVGTADSPTADPDFSIGTQDARVDLVASAPEDTFGIWVIAEGTFADAAGSFANSTWEEIHRLFFPFGAGGWDHTIPNAGTTVGTNAVLILNREASSAAQQAACVIARYFVAIGNGKPGISLHRIEGVPKPPRRVRGTGTTTQSRMHGVASGGRLANYRILLKPVTLDVEAP